MEILTRMRNNSHLIGVAEIDTEMQVVFLRGPDGPLPPKSWRVQPRSPDGFPPPPGGPDGFPWLSEINWREEDSQSHSALDTIILSFFIWQFNSITQD